MARLRRTLLLLLASVAVAGMFQSAAAGACGGKRKPGGVQRERQIDENPLPEPFPENLRRHAPPVDVCDMPNKNADCAICTSFDGVQCHWSPPDVIQPQDLDLYLSDSTSFPGRCTRTSQAGSIANSVETCGDFVRGLRLEKEKHDEALTARFLANEQLQQHVPDQHEPSGLSDELDPVVPHAAVVVPWGTVPGQGDFYNAGDQSVEVTLKRIVSRCGESDGLGMEFEEDYEDLDKVIEVRTHASANCVTSCFSAPELFRWWQHEYERGKPFTNPQSRQNFSAADKAKIARVIGQDRPEMEFEINHPNDTEENPIDCSEADLADANEYAKKRITAATLG